MCTSVRVYKHACVRVHERVLESVLAGVPAGVLAGLLAGLLANVFAGVLAGVLAGMPAGIDHRVCPNYGCPETDSFARMQAVLRLHATHPSLTSSPPKMVPNLFFEPV